MLDEQALMEYLNQDDPVIEAAIDVFKHHAAFPKKANTTQKPTNNKQKKHGK